MIKVVIPLLYLIGLSVSNLWADTGYMWPMKLNPELTSKFCDYRSGHFHSGLDIRTQGKTGFRVYAIDDGHIYRVVTSFRGYGRAVYVMLRDGRIVVYGHLSGFTEAVENRIFSEQMKSEKYSQDLFFSSTEYPVKKGAIVGYSGESGSGAPHLHFEIRSRDNNPINPLRAGMKVNDTGRPEFHDLAIRYFPEKYLPDGSHENYDQIEIIPVKVSTREHTLADTIICGSQMMLSVSGGDRIAGQGFLYGFYGLKLYLDDSLLFQMLSDSLSFSSTRQLNYIRDFGLIKLFSSKPKVDNDANIFFRLYVPPFSRQFFWPGNMKGAGIVYPMETIGHVRNGRLVAFDEAGNEATLRFYIRQPELNFTSPEEAQCFREGDNIYFIINTPEKPKSIFLEYRNSIIEEFKPIQAELSSSAILRETQDDFIDTIKVSTPKSDRDYRLRYQDDHGRTSPWLYFHESQNLSRLLVHGSPDMLRMEFRSQAIKSAPTVHLRNDSLDFSEMMRAVGPNLYYAEIVNRNLTGPILVGIESGGNSIFDTTIFLQAAIPNHAGEAVSPDSTLRIQFDKSSAYYPAYISPSGARRESTAFGPAIIYEISPANLLFDTPVRFIFDTAKLGLAGSKVGVYGASGDSKGWNFISKIDGARLEAGGIGLGRIAILEDNISPTISSIAPGGSVTSMTPHLSCVIRDNLSGLSLENGLSMTIDGRWVPAEFDVDTGRFAYRVRNPLKPGRHLLEIKASDNQGNSATKQSSFTVTGKKK
jgi:hypothetical protein